MPSRIPSWINWIIRHFYIQALRILLLTFNNVHHFGYYFGLNFQIYQTKTIPIIPINRKSKNLLFPFETTSNPISPRADNARISKSIPRSVPSSIFRFRAVSFEAGEEEETEAVINWTCSVPGRREWS